MRYEISVGQKVNKSWKNRHGEYKPGCGSRDDWGEYSRNFLVKIILTCYIFEYVEKVHLRGHGKVVGKERRY